MNWVQARAREVTSWFDARGDDVYLYPTAPDEIIDIVTDSAQKSAIDDRHHYLMVFLVLDAIDRGKGSHKKIEEILKAIYPINSVAEDYRNSDKRRWNSSMKHSHGFTDLPAKEAFLKGAGIAYNEELMNVFENIFDGIVLK